MEYDPDFEKCFMRRTLEIVRNYQDSNDATLLVNCLLGLLVVPKEKLFKKIPLDEELSDWGIDPDAIKKLECDFGYKHELTVQPFVRCLRHAVAHFDIEPIHADGVVTGFKFSGRGFKAELMQADMQSFVTKLAEYLEANA